MAHGIERPHWSESLGQSTGEERNTNPKQDKQRLTHSQFCTSNTVTKRDPRSPQHSSPFSATALLTKKEYFLALGVGSLQPGCLFD